MAAESQYPLQGRQCFKRFFYCQRKEERTRHEAHCMLIQAIRLTYILDYGPVHAPAGSLVERKVNSFDDREMEIQHFGHEAHPLKHMEDIDGRISFACCNKWYPDRSDEPVEGYGCEDCKYFIHKSCSEIPNEINHFYHPNHTLKLRKQQTDCPAAICVACSIRYDTSTYRCSECPNFEMDVECVMLSFTTKNMETAKTLHYPHHGHPLSLHEKTNDDSTSCDLCLQKCLGPTYECYLCPFYIHESCTNVNIPQEIYHYFHSQDHPLILATTYKNYKDDLGNDDGSLNLVSCEACKYRFPGCLRFECLKCCFYMDVECALVPTTIKQSSTGQYIEHFSHYHPLRLCDDYKTQEIHCSCCKRQPSAGGGYKCDYCSFFLHEACFDQLAQRIEAHPFHPSHALTLRASLEIFTCYACMGTFSESFGYKCSESYNIILDLKCASIKPSVKFESHPHLLTLFKSIDTDTFGCNVCHEKCEKYSDILRCVQCNYNLHVLCGPLPCAIEDKCHTDPLELMDHFVEDYDDAGNFYCDTCEQLRDPRECVYFCKDCNFISEIKCVMPEVLRSLEGVRGKMPLRTTTTKSKSWIISGRVISDVEGNIEKETDNIQVNYSDDDDEELDGFYRGLKDFFTVEEGDEVCKILNAAGVSTDALQAVLQGISISMLSRFKSVEFGDPEYRVLNEASPYTDDAFTKLMERLDLSYGISEMLAVFQGYQVVRIEGLVIFKELAPCLKGLLQEYNDFTAKSNVGSRVKMFFLTIFCSVVREMCITDVGEINEHLLNKWWKCLKAVQHAEFEIEFAMDRLHKITQTFFGLHARASITAKESKFDELTMEVREIEDKLEAKRLQLEALKLEIVGRKNALKYPSSPLIKECDNLVAEFKYKKAWDGSPIMFQNFTSSGYI